MRRWILVGAFAVLSLFFYYVACAAPADFPSGDLIVVSRGASAGEVAQQLADARVIKQPLLLRILLRIDGTGGAVQAGVYRFESPQNLFSVTRRLVTGDYRLPPVRLTFIEGAAVRDMAAQIAEAFSVSGDTFSAKAKPYEGYLFPDTYLFPVSATADSILATLRKNFDIKTAPLAPDVAASGRPLSDIVIMASLIEKEARTTLNRRIVAGILWKRLARGMPLQVDAVFGYIYNRDTYSPSLADLKVDSPYNTYLHKGLPPTPINNPGLDALEAVLHPVQTEYVYYLTGNDDLMHYATTYAEHQANQRKYLKK